MASAPKTSQYREQALGALRAAGMRVTPQRLSVLASVMGEPSDCTAQSLHAQLVASDPTLGLATVYRTLGALADADIIDTMQHGQSTCYRWCSPGHHHHLVCDSCHKVVEIHDCDVSTWADRVARANGFSDVRHVVELRGRCTSCRAT